MLSFSWTFILLTRVEEGAMVEDWLEVVQILLCDLLDVLYCV